MDDDTRHPIRGVVDETRREHDREAAVLEWPCGTTVLCGFMRWRDGDAIQPMRCCRGRIVRGFGVRRTGRVPSPAGVR